MLKHESEPTIKFLNALDADGQFTFQTLDDKKTGTAPVKTLHGSLAEHLAELQRLNNLGAGVFVTVNETNGKGRKADDIVRIRAHFIDSDNEPIEEVCKRLSLKPHLMVETSEGKGHAYYLVSDSPLDEFKDIQERFIQALGTDKTIKDLPRLMRLPGFYHMKGEPRLVRLIHADQDLKAYSKEEILNALPNKECQCTPKECLIEKRKADPTIPQSDGFRTESLESLIGQLLAKRDKDEEIFKWITLWNDRNNPPLPEEKIINTIQSMRKTDQRNHPERYVHELEYTDTGNAKRLVAEFGNDIRYCHDRGEWMFWDGQRWVWDIDGEIVRKATASAASIINNAGKLTNISEIDKVSRWTKQSLSASGLKNMINLAQNDRSIATNTSKLDQNHWVLNVSNGTLDLKNFEFMTHSRADLNTKMADVAYKPSDECTTWLKFLDKIFNGDQELIAWLQKVVGYTLTGSIDEQCAFFLIGDGCNGKSTFLNTIKRILGDYAVQAHPDSFMVNRFSSAGGTRSDLIRLAGTRMAIATEGEDGQQLAEAFIKQITGGEEISARGLYQKNQIEFLPKFKLFYCSNHKPRISGTDNGIWRRIRVIPFNVCIPEEERDSNMISKLLNEASGILNWAYEGCLRWQEEELKDIPAAVVKASNDYRGENDVIGRFMSECVVKGDDKIYSSHLYRAYAEWSLTNGENKKSTIQFKQYLLKNGLEEGKDKRGIYWKAISFTDCTKAMAEVA